MVLGHFAETKSPNRCEIIFWLYHFVLGRDDFLFELRIGLWPELNLSRNILSYYCSSTFCPFTTLASLLHTSILDLETSHRIRNYCNRTPYLSIGLWIHSTSFDDCMILLNIYLLTFHKLSPTTCKLCLKKAISKSKLTK